jgi:hypothetical protein
MNKNSKRNINNTHSISLNVLYFIYQLKLHIKKKSSLLNTVKKITLQDLEKRII